MWPPAILLPTVIFWFISLLLLSGYVSFVLLPHSFTVEELVQYAFKALMVWGVFWLIAYFSFDFTAQREIYELIKLCRLLDLPTPPDYTKSVSARP